MIPQNWLYPSSFEEAKKVQEELSSRVLMEDHFDAIEYLGGADISHNLYDPKKLIHAAIVVLDKKNLSVHSIGSCSERQDFPYVPGFLGFREAPSLVKAFQSLKLKPQVLLVDGHGISHPRGLGIASHLGVLLDIPTIGVAKSILVGKPKSDLPNVVGAQVPLLWKGKEIGMLLRTKKNCKPLIISTGHRVSLESALQIVQECLTKYRLPEPTRQAHIAANHLRGSCSLLS